MRSAVAVALLAFLALVTMLSPFGAAQPEQVHASWLGTNGAGLDVGIAWVRPGDVRDSSQDGLRVFVEGAPELQGGPVAQRAYIGPGVTVHKTQVFVGKDLWAAGGISYQVGSDAGGWSAPFRFPSWPAEDEPWRFAAYGDHGVGSESNASAALVPAVAARRPHAVLHLGDIAYADGTPAVWDEWFRMAEPLAASTLYMATPGNHEHEGYHVASGPSPDQAGFTGSLADPYDQYRQRFHFPGTDLRYSFDLGPVHVVSINSEDLCVTQPVTYPLPWRASPNCGAENQEVPLEGDRPLPPNQGLLDWLEADLAAHADAPWTFVMLHRPVYSGGSYSGESVLREHFVPVFERHGVDLVLSGHDHNYQRSYPLLSGERATDASTGFPRGLAPVYIVSGGAGEGFYSLAEPSPAWTASRSMAFHHLAIDVWTDGLRVTALDTFTGEALDSFVIGTLPDVARPSSDRGTPLPALAAVAAIAVAALASRRA